MVAQRVSSDVDEFIVWVAAGSVNMNEWSGRLVCNPTELIEFRCVNVPDFNAKFLRETHCCVVGAVAEC